MAVSAQAGRALAIGAVSALVLTEAATIPLLAASGFIVGFGEVITDGGLPAVVRAVVEPTQLELANSRLTASQTVANMFVGPPLAALFLELNPAAPFLAAAGLYAATIALLASLTGRFGSEAEAGNEIFVLLIIVAMAFGGASHPAWNVVSVTIPNASSLMRSSAA